VGSNFLLIGLLLLIAYGIVSVIQNLDILGKWQKAITAGKPTALQTSRKKVGLRVGEDEEFTARMNALPADTLLTIRDPNTGAAVNLQVVTPEVLFGCGESPVGSGNWVRTRVRWSAVVCKAEPAWSRTPVLLVQLDTAGYLLKRRVLGPEEVVQWQSDSKRFAHNKAGQIPGAVSTTYKGSRYAIQDVGVWQAEGLFDDPHIPAGLFARWTVAHGNGSAIIIEDCQGNNDSVWEGPIVDLDTLVKDVLTPDGR